MKHPVSPEERARADERRARVRKVSKRAKMAGEKVPRGMKLISFRDLKAVEIVHGKSLDKVASACLSRKKAVA